MKIVSVTPPLQANVSLDEIHTLKLEIEQLKENLLLTQQQLAALSEQRSKVISEIRMEAVPDSAIVSMPAPPSLPVGTVKTRSATTPQDPLFAQLWAYVNQK